MTPIDRALAKIAALQEAEKRMTESPWVDVTTQYQPPGYPRALIHYNVFNDVIAPNVVARDSAGISLLRNAAPAMLDLLEALLAYYQSDGHDMRKMDPYGSPAEDRVDAALAAFVEGSDAA